MSDGNAGGSDGGVVTLNNPGNGQGSDQNTGQNSGAGDNKNSGTPDLLSTFQQDDNRKYAEQKGWKDPDALLSSYRELEKAYSKAKSGQPGQANGQQTATVDERVVPTAPSDYEFKLPEGFPTDGAYDKSLAELFRGWSHKAKLSKSEAQVLHDSFATHMATTVAQARQDQAKKFNEQVQSAFTDLSKEWGNPGTPGFDRALEMGRRAMNHLDPGLKEALSAHGIIAKDAKGNEVVANSTIFKALSKVGARLFAEDNVFGAPAQSENPFDPKKPNAQKAGELIRKNPEMARNLINAAGPEAQNDWAWWLARQ